VLVADAGHGRRGIGVAQARVGDSPPTPTVPV
jgi:hypothetical protein